MWAQNGGFSSGDELSLISSYLALTSATVSTPEKLLHGLHSTCAGVRDARMGLCQKPCQWAATGSHCAGEALDSTQRNNDKGILFFFFFSVYFQIGNYKGNFLSLRLAGVSTTPWARQSSGCNLSRSDVKHGNPGT